MTAELSAASSNRLLAVGLSHKTAAIEQRERTALHDRLAREVLRTLGRQAVVGEAVVLSTCNRTELYAGVNDPGAGETALRRVLLEHARLDEHRLECALYTLHEDTAVAHLFRVAAGLDSMVVGESEIQGQVRAAADRAAEERMLGPLLSEVYRHALAAGKRVRRETRVGAGAISVSSVAVDLARRRFVDLDACRAVLIGAGRTAESTARALIACGLRQLVVANRTVGAARALAAHFGGRGVGFDSLPGELRGADIVISSTNAPHRILCRGDLEAVMALREQRRLVVIDIAVPRDVEASAKSLPGLTLYDIDDLELAAEQNLNGRRREAERAELIILDELTHFRDWRRSVATAPGVGALWARAEAIRQSELAEIDSDSLSPEARVQLDAVTRSLLKKLLHEPTRRLRALEDGDERLRHLESLRYLFGLTEAEARPGQAGAGDDMPVVAGSALNGARISELPRTDVRRVDQEAVLREPGA